MAELKGTALPKKDEEIKFLEARLKYVEAQYEQVQKR